MTWSTVNDEAFTGIFSDSEFPDVDTGIVLQAYLPDTLPAIPFLVSWAKQRPGKREIKIRVVKGANLAMETADAAIHGWNPVYYTSRPGTDASSLRCVDWASKPENLQRACTSQVTISLHLTTPNYCQRKAELFTELALRILRASHHQKQLFLLRTDTVYLCVPHFVANLTLTLIFHIFSVASKNHNHPGIFQFFKLSSISLPIANLFSEGMNTIPNGISKKNTVAIGPQREQECPALARHKSFEVLLNEPDFVHTLPSVCVFAKKLSVRSSASLFITTPDIRWPIFLASVTAAHSHHCSAASGYISSQRSCHTLVSEKKLPSAPARSGCLSSLNHLPLEENKSESQIQVEREEEYQGEEYEQNIHVNGNLIR